MGYLTQYDLEVVGKSEQANKNKIIQELLEFSDEAKYAFDEQGDCIDQVKWYEHKEELRKFSKLHPKVVFKLYGVGEENQEMWHKYFSNGLMQYCPVIIKFDKFNKTKLK